MTIEEKRKLLNAYCNSTLCEKCVLTDGGWKGEMVCDECLHIATACEEDLDRAIALIKAAETKEAETNENAVDHPAHYNAGKIEVIDYIEDQKLGFCLGNAVKYISRSGKKDPAKEVEDLKKAVWYIERRIKQIEGAEK